MSIIKKYFETRQTTRISNKILGLILIAILCIGLANTLDYFFAGKNYLNIYKGRVDKVFHENYMGPATRRNRARMHTRTILYLENNQKEFKVSDYSDYGGYINVSEGDFVTLYTRKWLQVLYFLVGPSNIYIVEKDGKWIYNNTSEWRGGTFANMIMFGGMSFFLLLIYLDLVWDISIFKWIRKRLT